MFAEIFDCILQAEPSAENNYWNGIKNCEVKHRELSLSANNYFVVQIQNMYEILYTICIILHIDENKMEYLFAKLMECFDI